MLRWDGHPTIFIGIDDPRPHEIMAIRTGRTEHHFAAATNGSAYIVLEFFGGWSSRVTPIFAGEVFFSAAKQPGDFTDALLAEARAALPKGLGYLCTINVVNSKTNMVVAMRAYSWSRELSLAFLDACEQSRTVTVADAIRQEKRWLTLTNQQLARQATVRFTLKGI